MNILSLISFFNAYTFVILGVYIFTLDSKNILNRLAANVNFCFAIWAFSFTFLYAAPTASSAFFWHKMGSVGWTLFCPFATHFFLVLSGKTKTMRSYWYFLLYALPITLVLKSIFSSETPVAKGVVQSKIGLGWTYISNIESIWYWLYVIHILIYFGIGLYLTYKRAKGNNTLRQLKQAKGIILLDCVMICIGFTTDMVIPAFSPIIPPIFILLSIFWGIGFMYLVKSLKLISVNDVATPDLILKTVMDPIIMLDNMGIIRKCNQATPNLLKYSVKEIMGRPFLDFCKEKYSQQKINLLLKAKSSSNIELDLVDYNGNIINTLASIGVAENKLDGIVGIVLNIHDVTKSKKIEAELYKRKEIYKELSQHFDRLANYDMLTDLPNRRLFFDKLELALENYKISGHKFALAFIDLDNFKEINDSYGHDIGDLLLVKVSKMLVECVRKQDIITRIGGDEFVIIFSDLHNDTELEPVIERIKDNFSKSIVIKNYICAVGTSIGISKCPQDGTRADELMRIADERMYKSKMVSKLLSRS